MSDTERETARVLVVDDSTVVRTMLSRAIERRADLEVQATAANGRLALERFRQRRPDVVVLDVDMPEMGGIETLVALRKIDADVPVVVFSSRTSRGADVTLDALSKGATDYVCKPAVRVDTSATADEREAALLPLFDPLLNLLAAVTAARRRPGRVVTAGTRPRVDRVPWTPLPQSREPGCAPEIVAIGSSTGGPQALETVLTALPEAFPLPVVITQHIPPVFSARLADRLNRLCRVEVKEAADGDVCLAGHVYIAPGDRHLLVKVEGPKVVLRLDDGPLVQSCRPSVDVMFASIADAGLGAATVAAILTGMGADGLDGCRRIRDQGGVVITQDEETSVVWGMPGYVTEAGLAEAVLPISMIAAAIEAKVAARAR